MPISMRNLSLLFIFSTSIAFAQLEDVGDIAEDLVFLSAQYVDPAAEAAVYQSSGGWFTSAKKKELWELEVSIQGNILFIPNKNRDFLINEDQLQNIEIQGLESTALSPTALGGDNTVVLEGHIGDDFFEFDSPEGLNESYVKHAQLQAGLGLWYGTTFIVRYSPKIKFDKTYYQILGVGLQHNISQWIPFLKDSSFDVAGLITYSDYTVSDNFSDIKLPLGTVLNSVKVDGESFMFNVIASKQVKNFNFSTALGLTATNFEYTIGGDVGALDVLSILNQALNEADNSLNNFKIDLGVDYKIHDFSVNTMLTFGKYTNLIFGVNYNFNNKKQSELSN